MASATAYLRESRQSEQDALIVEHLEYVQQIFGQLVGKLPAGVDRESLLSAGTLGLVEAARKYDPTHEAAFKTYAYPRIRGAIVDELRRSSPVPQRVLKMMAQVREAKRELPAPATIEDIAAHTGLRVEDIDECLQAQRLTQQKSWSDVLDEQCLAIHGRSETTAGEYLEQEERVRILADAIEQLPERERTVLTLYYLEELRQQEIGEVIGVSVSRVSRVLARAEEAVREHVRAVV